MKKKLIKIKLIMLTLVVIIAILGTIFFIYQGKNSKLYDNSFVIQKKESVDINNCSKVSLDFSSANITFKATDGSKVTVTEKANGKLNDDEKFSLTQDENNITIGDKSKNFIRFFHFNKISKQIEVDIPKDYSKDLEVDTSSGGISFESDITLNSLKSEESSGNFNCDNVKANSIRLKTTSGKINTGNIAVKNYDVNITSGSIYIKGISGSGQVTATSGLINVNYKDIGDYSNVKSTSGSINLTIPKELSIKFYGKFISGKINSNFHLNYKGRRDNEASGRVGRAPFKNINTEITSGKININKIN